MPRNFTIAEKCKILDEYEAVRAKQSQREFAKEKGIDPKTLRNILGKAVEYRELANTKHITDRKRKREAEHQDIDQALITWFGLARKFNAVITGLHLRSKAESFARDLGFSDWVCTESWVNRWKKRHNISYKVNFASQNYHWLISVLS